MDTPPFTFWIRIDMQKEIEALTEENLKNRSNYFK
jgi:hypothetical protein